MGYFRFQRRIGIGKFGRINVSKSGVSLSEGVRGAHVTIGKTPRVTLGIPGSGLSWTQTFGGHGRRVRQAAAQFMPRWAVLAIIGALIALAIFGGH
jgi:hypothetical protein